MKHEHEPSTTPDLDRPYQNPLTLGQKLEIARFAIGISRNVCTGFGADDSVDVDTLRISRPAQELQASGVTGLDLFEALDNVDDEAFEAGGYAAYAEQLQQLIDAQETENRD